MQKEKFHLSFYFFFTTFHFHFQLKVVSNDLNPAQFFNASSPFQVTYPRFYIWNISHLLFVNSSRNSREKVLHLPKIEFCANNREFFVHALYCPQEAPFLLSLKESPLDSECFVEVSSYNLKLFQSYFNFLFVCFLDREAREKQ